MKYYKIKEDEFKKLIADIIYEYIDLRYSHYRIKQEIESYISCLPEEWLIDESIKEPIDRFVL